MQVGEQWLSATDECMICECLMGSNIPSCHPVCDEIPEVDEMHELVYEEGSCCPTVKPLPGNTSQTSTVSSNLINPDGM